MKMNRRKFGTLAGLSATGLILPWATQAGAKTNDKTSLMGRPVAAPDPGKNWHPLAAQRPHKDILGRLQGLMQRDGFDALILVAAENILYSTGYYSMFAYAPGIPAGAQTIAVIPAKGDAHLSLACTKKMMPEDR
jgi:hypothetical protein